MMKRRRMALKCGALTMAFLLMPPAMGADQVYGPPSEPSDRRMEISVDPMVPRNIPPVLAAVTDEALDSYPAIRSAEAEVRAAQSDVRGTKWLRFPSLSIEGLAATKGNSNAAKNGVATNVTLEQPIWTGGKIGGTIRRAEALWLVSKLHVQETAREVSLRLTQYYFEIALNARRKEILTQSLEQHRNLVQTISNRVSQEVSPRADLDLANSRTALIVQELTNANAQIEAAYNQVVQMVGHDVDLGSVPTYIPELYHPQQQDVMEQALQCDPKIQRLRAQFLVAEADRQVAKASIFPQLLGQLSHNEITGSRAGVALRMQTGNGLSQIAAVSSAGARIDAAGFAIHTAERELVEALRLDFVTNRAAGDRVQSSSSAAQSSALVTESYKRQFIAGRRTWLDVMNALRETMTSELSVAEAEVSAMSSSSRILLRSCAWQPFPVNDSEQDTVK